MQHNNSFYRINYFIFYSVVFMLILASCDEKSKPQNGIFDSDSILNITLTSSFNVICKDIDEKRFFHQGTIYIYDHVSKKIPVRIKTRGYFRRDSSISKFPPLKLKFKKKDTEKSIFANIKTLKIVFPCSLDSADIQQFAKEYVIYKLYSLFTPISFKVRLCNLTISDIDNNNSFDLPAFFIEDMRGLGKRNHGKIKNTPYLENNEVNDYTMGFIPIFQFMIGNNDWSVYYLHNMKLLYKKTLNKPIPIPYDFDMSEFVGAEYAIRDTENTSDTLYLEEAYYNGNFVSDEELQYIFRKFENKRDSIISIIQNSKLLNTESKFECKKYLENFYTIIRDDSLIEVNFRN